MNPPKLYLSLHHIDGQSYNDELDYDGYQRIELNESNWKTKGKMEGYNTKFLNFGRADKEDDRTAKFIGLGTGTALLMSVRIGEDNPYELYLTKGMTPVLPKKSFHIRPKFNKN